MPPITRGKKKTKDDDTPNKSQPKKSRRKAIKSQGTETKDASLESNASESLTNDIKVEGVDNQVQESKKWTPEQRLQLIEAVLKKINIPWDEICNEVNGGKSEKMCYDQWRRVILPGLKTSIKFQRKSRRKEI
ncbi:13634_t:CDS:2 [Funneliformis geosporum]|uniref:10454_t:CDS:1 n=1 Tax=Funneliformis geosporum TaxID=1117311 RepID=A0A9W4SPP6_9GLOM|nr:10454_t:CDS:2 [Funneliformis geosporum]CAI2179771.1 13634_t:CDS:2 [Funneliformis geosporum]